MINSLSVQFQQNGGGGSVRVQIHTHTQIPHTIFGAEDIGFGGPIINHGISITLISMGCG